MNLEEQKERGSENETKQAWQSKTDQYVLSRENHTYTKKASPIWFFTCLYVVEIKLILEGS